MILQIAANSWGEDWGEVRVIYKNIFFKITYLYLYLFYFKNGYFRIVRNDKDTEFGRYVYAAYGTQPSRYLYKTLINFDSLIFYVSFTKLTQKTRKKADE